ncbi:ABC transporter ATP-binding protein [Streptomyces sp. MP131-18]|uniref:ABC transporter transmembrane domain-containing protein n=1 Tax=Streptomyces sp. MP131-18 TaxID=1857892 RepID=UPI00097C9B76|nr:ABC transporter ATP-binding protein [Streptomyces sp. MP131-18]ONK15816.1 putative multidrug resistance ABC transporter ATP-binding/permease protein YheI [Streptomyces sp. MP131-18]
MTDAYVQPSPSDSRTPGRYLWWLVTRQRRRIATGSLLGMLWMTGMMVPPYVLARAIDDGLAPRDWPALGGWSAAFLGVAGVNALLAVALHRTMTKVRMEAAFRTAHVVVVHTTRLGASFSRQVTAGEVVTIAMTDVGAISNTLTLAGPGLGALLSYGVAAVLLFSIAPALGAVVLIGTLLLALLIGPLLVRLQRVDAGYREHQSALAARLVDVVGGLRVLGGLGGKEVYAGRYRRGSQALRAQGHRVGAVTSWVQALGGGLPTLFLAAVTWLAARAAVRGTISVGELVAAYGYAAVLAVPVSFLIKSGHDITRGLVAGRRLTRFLALEPDVADRGAPCPAPAPHAPLRDPASGVEVAPGRLTALAGARRGECADVVDRLCRFAPSAVTWGGVRLDQVPLERVRARVLVADNDAELFPGTLREVVSGRGSPDDEAIERAVHAAMAQDIVRALPAGLDSPVRAHGGNLSGGQRQRLRLARALLADPEVLATVEPTSAVDAHTEAAVAARLRAARAGRTTLVTSTSPLLLAQADTVYYLVDGKVSATGTHRELLRTCAGYRGLVSRGGPDAVETPPADRA